MDAPFGLIAELSDPPYLYSVMPAIGVPALGVANTSAAAQLHVASVVLGRSMQGFVRQDLVSESLTIQGFPTKTNNNTRF